MMCLPCPLARRVCRLLVCRWTLLRGRGITSLVLGLQDYNSLGNIGMMRGCWALRMLSREKCRRLYGRCLGLSLRFEDCCMVAMYTRCLYKKKGHGEATSTHR